MQYASQVHDLGKRSMFHILKKKKKNMDHREIQVSMITLSLATGHALSPVPKKKKKASRIVG